MHMADALAAPAVAGTMYVCSAAAAAYSVKKIRLDVDTKKVPVMGVMGAFVFAAQMINFTIPGTGSSGHLCGGMLLSALLGPYAGFLTMIGVLLIQGLLFADGGLLVLGCNVWNMAFYGCFLGALLIWKPLMKHGMSRAKIAVSAFSNASSCPGRASKGWPGEARRSRLSRIMSSRVFRAHDQASSIFCVRSMLCSFPFPPRAGTITGGL